MRRILGAVLLVFTITVPRLCERRDRCGPPPSNVAGTSSTGDAKRGGVHPGRGVAKRHSVPSRYREEPLLYLSTAPVDSLILLPGIGPVIAERMASARTGKRLFSRWEDLLAIKGIGPKKLQVLRSLAGAGEEPPADRD